MKVPRQPHISIAKLTSRRRVDLEKLYFRWKRDSRLLRFLCLSFCLDLKPHDWVFSISWGRSSKQQRFIFFQCHFYELNAFGKASSTLYCGIKWGSEFMDTQIVHWMNNTCVYQKCQNFNYPFNAQGCSQYTLTWYNSIGSFSPTLHPLHLCIPLNIEFF